MKRFDKNNFISEVFNDVKDAINNKLITPEDIDNNDKERLKGFIQYRLLEYIQSREDSLSILNNLNYDESYSWNKLESDYGKIKSLKDIALINLWEFVKEKNLNNYSIYNLKSEEYLKLKEYLKNKK